MKKLLVFDIDGTLCDVNQPVGTTLLHVLRALSKSHYLVLASGKPFSYIAGFVRQLGLENCIAISENGACISYGATFPPETYDRVLLTPRQREVLLHIKSSFLEKFQSKIWMQPNDINVTVFPLEMVQIDAIHAFARNFEHKDLQTYLHHDSVDFTIKGYDKGSAVEKVLRQIGLSPEQLYVFGDGCNDLPMLKKTRHAYLVNATLQDYKPCGFFKSYEQLAHFLEHEFF